jgi:hypothetical protein
VTVKVLGQLNPAATTLTDLYTVGASTSAVTSTLCICNQAAVGATFRVTVAVAGAANNAKQYVAYDSAVAANDTVFLTIGMTLATTDVVRVYASSTTLSFVLFGEEN